MPYFFIQDRWFPNLHLPYIYTLYPAHHNALFVSPPPTPKKSSLKFLELILHLFQNLKKWHVENGETCKHWTTKCDPSPNWQNSCFPPCESCSNFLIISFQIFVELVFALRGSSKYIVDISPVLQSTLSAPLLTNYASTPIPIKLFLWKLIFSSKINRKHLRIPLAFMMFASFGLQKIMVSSVNWRWEMTRLLLPIGTPWHKLRLSLYSSIN